MKILLSVEIQLFETPNFVIPVSSKGDRPGIPITDLDAQTLEVLCDEFRASVFSKAGKERPALYERDNRG